MKDRLYASRKQEITPFKFNSDVVKVFPDMISRSVPGYHSVLEIIDSVFAKFANTGSEIYDLGCSLGAASLMLAPRAEQVGSVIKAVDNSPAMIDRLRKELADYEFKHIIKPCLADICDISIANASFTVMNYTLQFVPPAERKNLLTSIYHGLEPGGGLFISEKIAGENESEELLLRELHENYKTSHGYSQLEIAQKRTSLENVLIPETLSLHFQRLREIGFKQIILCLRHLNFVSLLAVK